MPNLTTAVEWARWLAEQDPNNPVPKDTPLGWHWAVGEEIETHARQQVEAAEEALLESTLVSGCIQVVADLHRYGATSYADAIQAVERHVAQQVEAFRERAARVADRAGRPDRITYDIAAAIRALEPNNAP